MDYVSVYDQSGAMLAVLDNADGIGYELKHNDLWTGSFSLPGWDEKNEFCQAHNLVRLPDGPRKTGLFRVISMPWSDLTGLGGMKTYSLEHVMATLLDDVLFGYHEIGGTGINTRAVMEYILAKQTVRRWQLGTVDFNDYFQYHFENVSLLSALLSLGEVLTEEYTWEFDTDTTPWTVNLRRADSAAGCGIYYQRNLIGIEKTMDATTLVTRLYPLGYGEGVNQLTIESVNGGAAYIDADTLGAWGVKCSVWTDTRIQDAETLLARARQVLEGYKNPYITYTAKALDLYRQTGYSWDNFMPGKLVTVMDGEHGVTFQARIVSIRKDDVNGDPGDIEITIANAPRDAADSINTLADRVGIGELYSQGATNLYAVPFQDNADPTHPAKMRVYVPRGLVRINRMLLSWQVASFRAYETGAAAGGSTETTSAGGGASTETTSAGGATTATSAGGGASTATSEAGGGATITEPQRIVSTTSEAGLPLAPLEYSHMPRTGGAVTQAGAARNSTDEAGAHTHNGPSHSHAMGHFHYGPSHTHTGPSHHHTMTHYHYGDSHTHTGPSHYHTIDSHSHGFTHYHYAPSHRHSLNSHTHSLNGHRHSVSVDYIPWSGNTGTNSNSTGESSGSTGYGGVDLTGSPTYSDGSGMTYTGGSGQLSSNYAGSGATSSGGGGLTGAPRTYDGGSLVTNTGDGGTGATGAAGDGLTSNAVTNGGNSRVWTEDNGTGATSEAGGHTHGMAHVHEFDHIHRVVVDMTIPGQELTIPPHTHSVSIGSHTHDVSIPDHTHSVSIGSHTHSVSIPDHTHGMVYGIYEGGRAQSVTILVDGNEVPAEAITAREIDVSPWMSKDQDGKITRNTWHEIQIVPDGLTRIEANLFAQCFVQSVGGGDY